MCNQVLILTVLQLVMRGENTVIAFFENVLPPYKTNIYADYQKVVYYFCILTDEFQETTWLLFVVTYLRVSVSCFAFIFEEFKVLWEDL